MAELIHVFSELVQDASGVEYLPRLYARQRDDRMWEGYIAFSPVLSGEVLVSGRETEQSHRREMEYWATGISVIYLEGSLARAQLKSGKSPPLEVVTLAHQHARS